MRSLDGAPTFGLLAACFLAACLGGCATSSLDMAPDRPDRPWSPTTAAGGEIVPGATSSAATQAGDYAYRNGVGSITDVTTAEIQVLQAKNAATDAYSTALTAAATLALATGALGSAPQ